MPTAEPPPSMRSTSMTSYEKKVPAITLPRTDVMGMLTLSEEDAAT